MARLGEILIEKGVLSPDGLRAGLDACRRQGGRLGTWLVRLGLVNEGVLLDALGQQSGCPTTTALDLATAPSEVRAAIPPELAKRHMVVAFARRGRALDIAMVNPNDLVLIDEINRLTGFTVRPHVATEAALSAALAIPVVTATATPPPVQSRSSQREWRVFWKLESTMAELFRAMDAPAWVPATHAAATFPFLAPIVGSTARAAAVATAAPEDLASALAAVTHRDQVASLILGALADADTRVALFSLTQGKVMAWAATGPGIVDEDFHTLILGLDRPSLFLALSQSGELHAGPIPPGDANALVLEALGQPEPREAVVTALKVRGKLAGFLWVDQGELGIGGIPLPAVREAARLATLALEILVLRQKIRTKRLDTAGAAD